MAKIRIGRKIQYIVQGIDLVRSREAMGWSQGELSQQIPSLGGQQYISRIEGQFFPHGVDKETVEKLMKAGFTIEFYDM